MYFLTKIPDIWSKIDGFLEILWKHGILGGSCYNTEQKFSTRRPAQKHGIRVITREMATLLTGALWSAFQPKLSKIFRANSSGQPAKMLVMCWHKITADQHTRRLETFLIIFHTFFMICRKTWRFEIVQNMFELYEWQK